MSFITFLGRRAVHSVFVVFGLSVLIFIIARIMPGDPARMAVGPRAPQWVVDNLREQMHLDQPLHIQYFYWLRDAMRGDFGISLVTRRPVADDIREFFPATLELALFAGVINGAGGIILGTISAWRKDSWVDNVVRVISYLGVVTPSFIFAVLFLLVFGMTLEWMPTMGRLSPEIAKPASITGLLTIDSLLAGNPSAFLDASWHLILPAVALALGGMSQEARITRSTMSDNLTKDYIASERSLGIPESVIMRSFLLKPSLIPTVSILGLDFAATIGNAFLVELIFNWPGISRYGINAMLRKDLNAISAVILILGVVFILTNIGVDIVVARLDPRIRLGVGRSE
ncbi:MAG: ABC transporter permease subunit [Anaerolineae bacterium]|nr:ABC transporter permease subunit [Anaerolineae bacterium]NIN94998.1 ABC transporter permease subunit [Anaerolineae bacterium]NIQ78039.1 ABC transporter permease subunit [Anaerolineae bacterium]